MNKVVIDPIQDAIDEKIWSIYNSNTTALSNLCRQLAFAEGGICWFFKLPNTPLSPEVKITLMLIAVFFMLDALQYFVAVLIFWSVAKYYEYRHGRKELVRSDQIVKKWWMSRFSFLFFLAKIACLMLASYRTILLLK